MVALLTPDARSILTRYETRTDPPNYFVRDLTDRSKRALTAFAHPQPPLKGVERQLVTYTRKDGVQLSATLYLPPGYKKGERLPVLMWAYPLEFTDAGAAGQITRVAVQLHHGGRRVAHAAADSGLRHLRQSEHADHRPGRDRQRHLRRATGGVSRGGRGQGGRDGRWRPPSDRRRRPQLRRLHDRQPAGPLATLPRRHRAQRRLQPVAHALRFPGRDADVLGGAGGLRDACRRSGTPTR